MMTEQHKGAWPEPTTDQLAQAERLTRTPDRLRYFLDKLDNPLWLKSLADHGWFDTEHVPEPVREDDGTVRLSDWPPASYLARIAGHVPEKAAEIIRTLTGTKNPWVQRQLVAALLALPSNMATPFVSSVVSWVRGPYAGWLDEQDLTALAVKFLGLADPSPGELLALTLLTATHDEYALGEVARALTHPLAGSGAAGVHVFIEALDQHNDDTHRLDSINFSRVSIGPHPQNQHLHGDTDPLVDGIRDAALAYMRRTGDLTVWEELSARPDALYRRIAYHIAAVLIDDFNEADQTAPSNAPQWVVTLRVHARDTVIDEAAFADPATRLEYGQLVHTMLRHLSAQDVATLTGWVRAGPRLNEEDIQRLTGVTDESVEGAVVAFADRWRAERLALFGPKLPELLQTVVDELASRGVEAPEYPGLNHVAFMWGTPSSPLSASSIADMPVDRVVNELAERPPAVATLFSTPESALADRVAEDIRSRPAEYAAHAEQFTSLDPLYINALLSGIRSAVADAAKQVHPDGDSASLDLAWPGLLRASIAIADLPDTGEPNALQPAYCPRWLHRSLAHMIEASLDSPAAGLTLDQADEVLAVIARLLESPDPVSADEAEDEATSDPTFRSINSVRGLALNAILAFVRWWSRHGQTEESIPARLIAMLEQHLDVNRDSSSAVRSVFGQHIGQLYALMPIWTRAHLEGIFGIPTTNAASVPAGRDCASGTSAADHDVLGQVAFDSHLLFANPYSDLWPLLAPYYEDAIGTLKQQPRGRQGALRDTRQRLLDHMLLFVVWGVLDVNDPRLKPVFRSKWAGEAFTHLGFSLQGAGTLDSDTAERLRNLWTWWRMRAETRRNSGDVDGAAQMVAGFSRWWHASKLGSAWEFEELHSVLALSPGIEAPSIVIQGIANKIEGHEREALEAIETILDNVTDDGRRSYASGKAEPILRELARSDDPKVRQLVQQLLQRLATWGMVELAQRIAAVAQ